MDLGIPTISGFLSFDDAAKRDSVLPGQLPAGITITCAVKSMSPNGRICNLVVDREAISAARVSGSFLPP